MSTIPGISIRSYALNEHKLCCKLEISYSDAIDLTNETISGLPMNRDLQEIFISDLNETLRQSIKDMREKRGCNR